MRQKAFETIVWNFLCVAQFTVSNLRTTDSATGVIRLDGGEVAREVSASPVGLRQLTPGMLGQLEPLTQPRTVRHTTPFQIVANLAWAQQSAFEPPLSEAVLEGIKAANAPIAHRRFQIGVGRPLQPVLAVNAETAPAARWTSLPDGSHAWLMNITSSGALGIRIHLENLRLPPSARILVYDALNPSSASAPITAETLSGQRDYWVQTVFSDQVIVECQLPPGVDPAAVTFTLGEISHIYTLPLQPGSLKEGTCHNDVTCYPAWAQEASGVARISFVDAGNAYLCSGCLITDNGGIPSDYFLTANHCIGSQGVASTLEFFWFYQTSTCNGAPPPLSSVPTTSGGADLLAHGSASDFSFLRLHQSPPGGTFHLNWTTTPPQGNEILTCIHHPTGAYKRISFGNLIGFDPNFWGVQWYSGVTEPGSSGSPLLNANHQIIGQLNGGFDGPGSSCSDPTAPDQFGRFDVSYAALHTWLGGGGGGPQFPFEKGTYSGLFSDPAGVHQQSAGFITISTTPKGAFTGRLQVANFRYAFSGKFDNNGSAQVSAGPRNAGIIVQLQIDASDSDHITGNVSSANWSADLSADRSVFDGRTQVPPQAGQYTMIIPGTPGSPDVPGGDSYATLTVSRNGRITMIGSLADGTKMSQSATLSKNAQWPLFISAYGGQGLVFAWVSFSDPMSGQVTWIKPSQMRAKFYSSGFSYQANLVGSSYVRPVSGQTILDLTTGTLAFNGGDLPDNIDDPVSLNPGNRLKSLAGTRLSASFSAGNGSFTGRVVDPATSKPISFSGVVLQEQTTASGWFPGTDQTGQVVLGP